MKKMAKRLVDATLLPLVGYVSRRVAISPHSVVHETIRRAVVDSTDYADSHMAQAICFNDIEPLWHYAFGLRQVSGLVVEFGVWRGKSISFFASLTKERIYGFDSFEGLREDWKGAKLPKGTFNLGGVLPSVPDNVTLVKGWFQDTLPLFLREHPEPFSFLHVDCDTYESTAFVLNAAKDRIQKGTVIVFDEYFGYRGWRLAEYKAWQEFVAAHDLSYEYVAFQNEIVVVIVT